MRLELRLDDPAKVSEETMTLKVELWRADLVTSIVALDASGIICPLEMEAVADLYPSGLVLGAPPGLMLDEHVSFLLPMMAAQPISMLLTENGLGPSPPGEGTGMRN